MSLPGDATPDSVRQEVLTRAETYYRGLELSAGEYETIMNSVSDFASIAAAERSYFILGSYGSAAKHRLYRVKEQLNDRPETFAFLMDDVARPWERAYAKFRLLGDFSDHIVGVAEHRCGGFLVEQGYFTAIDPYFRRTYVCKLTYPNDGIREPQHEHPYSWMQEGVFELLAAEDRLFSWRDEASLSSCVSDIP